MSKCIPFIPQRALNAFTPISEFNLSVRTANVLRARDIYLVGELTTYCNDEIMAWSDRRMRVYHELKSLLEDLGLDLFPNE
ncbi:DNA-directed RNA polymerase subunit alpha C-terminal domain-containing protein [Gemmatimonadota bacterium]